jgi:hypothetical protein
MQSCTCHRLAAAQLGRLHACGATGGLSFRSDCRLRYSYAKAFCPRTTPTAPAVWQQGFSRRAAGSAPDFSSRQSGRGCNMASQHHAGMCARPAAGTTQLRCTASTAEPAVSPGEAAQYPTQRPAAARRCGGCTPLNSTLVCSLISRSSVRIPLNGLIAIGIVCAGSACFPACSRRARCTLATTLGQSTTGSGCRTHTARRQ